MDLKLEKQVVWLGDSRKRLAEFPPEVKQEMGAALMYAQSGLKHQSVKAWKGFSGAGVLSIMESFDGDAYRAVYTVKLAGVVYALHAFKKKSKRGGETPKADRDKVERRLKEAERRHKEWSQGKRNTP
ncbi:MAG: type II toxin-antitoxin system RelE/ParE family toxin [Magnetococcales bacterium]|nr:type II toxin-antitoxin system RelE/ParE family toxin [Magnetococcales bacterium]